MKNILILSDTHMPKRAKDFPNILKQYLEDVDCIIHAGDFSTIDVYNLLKSYNQLIGVHGNIDDEKIRKDLPKKKLIKLEGITIGVTHGDGKGKTTEKRAIDVFKDDDIDILIYGHSHIPVKKELNDVVIFNPGSPTDKRRQPQYSFGLLQVNNNHFKIKHIFYSSKT